MKKAALFDMDGTLVDNTPAHIRAFEIFCDRYGVRNWKERLSQGFGMGNDDIMRLILPEEVIASRGLQALADEKEAIYREIYAPEIRPVAGLRDLLLRLRALGIRNTVMMTGDSERTAAAIAKQVGVDRFFAEVLPEDKANFVQQAKAEGHTVVMIGDGINDSPALSAADIGIAINLSLIHI